MSFRYIKELLCIGAVVFVSACGSSSGGESSTDTLLEDNTPPVAYDQNFTLSNLELKENTELDISLKATDKDGDVLSYTIIKYPQHGSLMGNLPTVIYIPDISYAGEDSFVFEVSDGISTARGVIDIVITKVNTPPKAVDDNVSVEEDTNAVFDVLSNDIDKDDGLDKKSLTLVKQPIYGIAKVVDGKVIYEPYKNYFGYDSLSYTIKDTQGAVSNEAIVNIDVISVNDAPVAVDDSVVLDNIQAVSIDVLKNDFDIDGNQTELKVVSVSQPQFGKSSVSSNLVLYSHTLDSGDTDSFSYTIEDSKGARATANVYIKIYQGDDTQSSDTNSSDTNDTIDTNKAPIAYDDYIKIDEDETVTFELNATDADNDKLEYVLTNSSVLPSHGVIVSQDNNTITYKPNREFAGKEYITFVANDGNVSSNQAVVTIEIASVNDAPVADAGEDKKGVTGDSFVLDGSKSYDVDGEIVSYEWIEDNQTISTQPTFSKLFTTEGVYRISLRVTDDKNATGMDEVVVDISLCNQGCIHPDPTQTVPFQ